MKNKGFWLIILILILTPFIYGSSKIEKSLAEIYMGGKVRFIPVLTIDDTSMPEDTFFESVSDVVCDNNGNVYACDYRANNIKKFDSSGNFIKTIGREGQGPGEFNRPFKIAITNERLIVWEQGNRRFCALSPDGEFIKSLTASIDEKPQQIIALPNGDLVIAMEKADIRERDKPQDYIIDIYSPDLEKKKTVYSHQIWRNKYIMKGSRLVNVPQPFSPYICWDVSPTGKIIVGNPENYEIEVYDSQKGKIFSFVHKYEPIKVTDKDKEKFFASSGIVSEGVMKMGANESTRKNTEFPKVKPAFHRLKVDSEGNILVMNYRKNPNEEGKFFDAFDSQGNYFGNVQITSSVGYPYYAVIRDGIFWMRRIDKEGFRKIIKYRISDQEEI